MDDQPLEGIRIYREYGGRSSGILTAIPDPEGGFKLARNVSFVTKEAFLRARNLSAEDHDGLPEEFMVIE